MTSLAKQLERLAVPHVQSSLGQDRRRASLLFDPKEAANLDKETVFALGFSGLEELETVDDLFEEFESTLFNKNSTDWERSMQTKEVNVQLDATIRQFLITLSPYFLLKSAHKTLEWLIYRYHINEFNKDDILLCILPYHDSKIFVRVLQLLNLGDPSDKWHWLQASAKHGASLARTTLCNHCKKDPGFLAFICDILPQFIKIHGANSSKLRAIIGLNTCAVLGTLQVKEDISEKIVSVLIPRLVQGTKSKCIDYTAATYMILSQLAVQTNLKTDVLNTLLPVITKKIKPSLTLEVLSCLSLLFQTQNITELPKKSFRHLSKVPGIVHMLANLTSRYDVTAFLKAYLNKLLPAAVNCGTDDLSSTEGSEEFSEGPPQFASIMNGFIQNVQLSDKLASRLSSQLIEELIEKRKKISVVDAVNSWTKIAKTLLSATQNKYSDIMDITIGQFMSKHKQDRVSMKILQEMTSLTLVPIKYQQIGSGQSLLLALNHASAHMRTLAVTHVVARLQENELEADDFVVTSLLSRLADDSPSVVEEVLKLDTMLCSIIDEKELWSAVTSLLHNKYTSLQVKLWRKVALGCVDVLGYMLSSNRDLATEVATLLLPFTFILNEKQSHQVKFAKAVMEKLALCAPGVVSEKVLKDWSKLCEDTDGMGRNEICAMNSIVFYATAALLAKLETAKANETFIKPIMHLTETQQNNTVAFFLLCVALEMLKTVKSREQILFVASLIFDLIKVIKVKNTQNLQSLEEICEADEISQKEVYVSMKWLRKHSCISSTTFFCAMNLMLGKLSETAPNEMWLGKEDEHTGLMVEVFELLMSKTCTQCPDQGTWRQLLTYFTQKVLEPEYLLRLCCAIWLHDDVTPLLHVGSYQMLACWFKSSQYAADALSDNSPFLATLLSALNHAQSAVRGAALECIKLLRRRVKEHVHAAILKKFVKQEDEIQSDGMHAQQSLGVMFKTEAGEDVAELTKHESSRRVTLTYLLKVIVDQNCPPVLRERLLRLLSEIPHQLVLEEILPLGVEYLQRVKAGTIEDNTYSTLELLLNRFDANSAGDVTQDSARLQFLMLALTTQEPNSSDTPSQIHAIKQIDKEFFNALPNLTVQQHIVTSLVDVAVSIESATSLGTCMHALKHVRLEAVHVQHELHPAADDATTIKARKRTRNQAQGSILAYDRVRVVLEALQARPKVKDSRHMTALLFTVLKCLLTMEHEEGEYCKQLVLSSLHSYCSKWTKETKPDNQESISVELLVQCIRSSKSPQTQQQALLVMAAVAHLFPEYILHHAMSIFTFMGDSLLQQDDSHTFQVITNTLNTLVPALVQAHGEDKSSTNLHNLITDILQVFVGARHHIPKHRCHVLFHTLMNTVGVEEYTCVLTLLIVESSVRNKDVPSLQDVDDVMLKDMSSIDRDIEFMCQISEKFSIVNQLHSGVRVLKLLQQLTMLNDDKRGYAHLNPKERQKRNNALHPLTVTTLSPQQLRLIEFHTTRFIAELLSRGTVISQIVSELESGNDVVRDLLESFVQECLLLVTKVAKAFGANSNTASAKFWRALLNKVYDILDKVNVLIPTPIFLHVISALMNHQQLTVRKKSLELLSNKLQQLDPNLFTPDEVEAVLLVVDNLSSMLGEQAQTQDADMMVQVKQLSLYSLRLLCRMLGQQQPQRFVKLFDTVTDLISTDVAVPVLGGALVCVGELCACLKAYAIPALAKFMPLLLPILGDMELMKKNDTLLVCSLTGVQKILSSLSHFLSPYLKQILYSVCSLSTLVAADMPVDNSNKNHPTVRLRNVKHHLAVDLAPRVLLPIITPTYDQLITVQSVCVFNLAEAARGTGVGFLLNVLKEHVEQMSREDLASHNALLLSTFLRVLDVRNNPDLAAQCTLIEDLCIEALLAMVVRLSEMTFRPFYYKLYNWACVEDSVESKNRKLTFFKLSTRLSERLKSLFNLFVSHSVKHACQLLDENNSSIKQVDFYGSDESAVNKSCELVKHILSMLISCFTHDSEGFVTKDIFNSLHKSLVNQLENTLGDESTYESLVSDHVSPCITQLAVAVHDDVSCKTLNYQICLKTRHDSAKVRYAALGCIEQLAHKLGDEYVTLLPESIPFLAELMEDESEDVEQQCQQVVNSLELLLGEPLKKYF